jgi:hypothetical protein
MALVNGLDVDNLMKSVKAVKRRQNRVEGDTDI